MDYESHLKLYSTIEHGHAQRRRDRNNSIPNSRLTTPELTNRSALQRTKMQNQLTPELTLVLSSQIDLAAFWLRLSRVWTRPRLGEGEQGYFRFILDEFSKSGNDFR
jgi:hypothetical protein